MGRRQLNFMGVWPLNQLIGLFMLLQVHNSSSIGRIRGLTTLYIFYLFFSIISFLCNGIRRYKTLILWRIDVVE